MLKVKKNVITGRYEVVDTILVNSGNIKSLRLNEKIFETVSDSFIMKQEAISYKKIMKKSLH